MFLPYFFETSFLYLEMLEKSKKALNKCMAICSRTEKCISDIQKKLTDWEIGVADSQKIIDQLIEEKFIDEKRYTDYYVRDKFRFNNWGKIKITYMLRGKGIGSPTINDALQQISEEEYLAKLNEMLAQKINSVKASNDYEKKMKLIRFAQGRGFEYNIINKVLATF